MTDFQVRHGLLLKILSPAFLKNDWQFNIATVELEGDWFKPSFPFAQSVDSLYLTGVLKTLVDERLDAIWVRARLKFIFGIDSVNQEERVEKSLSFFSFIASKQTDGLITIAVPFECYDYYGRTELYFSLQETDQELKASIADAFWRLITDESDLADFKDKAYHSMVGVWMRYGCKAGKPYFGRQVFRETKKSR